MDPIEATLEPLPDGLTQLDPLRCVEVTETESRSDETRFKTHVGNIVREGTGVRILDEGIRNDRDTSVRVFTDVEFVANGVSYSGRTAPGEGSDETNFAPWEIEPGQSWNGTHPVFEQTSLEPQYHEPGLESCTITIREAEPA